MPFPITDKRVTDPNVIILFSGLMIIRPTQIQSVPEDPIWHADIGVLRYATGHSLTVEIRVEGRAPKLPIFRLRGRLDRPITISVGGTEQGVKKYLQELTAGPLPGLQENDIRHAINLGSAEFYKEMGLKQDEKKVGPSIVLEAGTLYTAERSKYPVCFQKGGSLSLPRTVAAAIGAELSLGKHNVLMLTYDLNGESKTFPLNNDDLGDGERFVINISNTPDNVGTGEPLAHDEMEEYNLVMEQVVALPANQKITIGTCPGPADFNTAKVPCMTALADG